MMVEEFIYPCLLSGLGPPLIINKAERSSLSIRQKVFLARSNSFDVLERAGALLSSTLLLKAPSSVGLPTDRIPSNAL